MLKIYRIVARLFVSIMGKARTWILKHRIISLGGAGAIGLLLAFFTYTTVVDWLNIEGQVLKIIITILVFSLSILFVLLRYKFIGWILKYRKWSLLGAAVLGLGLATGVLILINKSGSDSCTALYEIITFIKENQVLVSSITILALGLPTFFTLWVFRTHDVQEQIKKTEENTNNSTFFECARLLATKDSFEDSKRKLLKTRIENSLSKKIALEQLAYLKRETSFNKKKIDLLTKNLSLDNKEFSFAQLSGINLNNADLSEAKLIDTDLSKADLSEADLSEADLSGANLSEAKLIGTDLSNIKCSTNVRSSGWTKYGLSRYGFSKAGLSGLSISNLKTNLSGADLKGAKLIGAKLKGAKLIEADLIEVDLTEADLTEADLKGADLSKAIYDDSKPIFTNAIYNSKTITTGPIIRKTIFPDWLDSEEKREEAKMIDISTREEDPES